MTNSANPPALSHLGICVSDLERSQRFYCEGLGFALVRSTTAGNEIRKLFKMEGEVRVEARFLRNGGTTIELMQFTSPQSVGDGARQPMNELGLAQLTFIVDDLDAAAATLRKLGGTVLDETHSTLAFPGLSVDVVSCCDPDGVRIKISSSTPTA